ncbi:GNAT family N-acetyltransferase [Desulfovibrio ferrophilus]|uniref:Acetyltransferase, GNAT family n=1 Tax=Desulfovibrio ferrophilus TaxID=241368 RepID=A0A2Z6AY77_9BACT|nr:GNAT family N-acetyltransferase [Desulfovibrio ferrophilus]BBD08211.1 acetyltransferase, GNAT family [Desulfovibrio ferrophilus]
MPIVIRQAGHHDIEQLLPLLGELCAMEQDFLFDEARQRRGLELLVDDTGSCVLMAELDGQTVGMCTAQIVISTAEGGASALVEDLVVDSRFRGRGLGRRLLGRLRRWTEGQGATRMQLLADRDNAGALGFYDRCGWDRTNMICLRTTDACTAEVPHEE